MNEPWKERYWMTLKLKRSLLFIPGNNPAMLQSCASLGADCVILDLEDAVAPRHKDEARRLVAYALRCLSFGDVGKVVRINDVSTPWWEADLAEVIPANPDVIRLPKVESTDDIRTVDSKISELERANGLPEGSIELHILLESARAVENVTNLVCSCYRIKGIGLGEQDLMADMGIRRMSSGEELAYIKGCMVLAAKAAGVDCFDSVYTNIDDTEGLLASTRKAAAMGFAGKSAIHPSQIRVINEGFYPPEEVLSHAMDVISAAKVARAEGRGVFSVNGKMVDGPVIRQAIHVLAQAGIPCNPEEILP